MTRRPPRRSAPVSEVADHPDTALEALPRSLAAEEESALRRLSPLRNRWPELAELDRRVAELEQRAAAASEELRMVMEERNAAPEHDARTHADWIAAGEKGDKPASSRLELDARIEELEIERDGLLAAAGQVLEQKVAFVQRHRGRLVKDADAHVTKLRERFEQLVGDLAATRGELLESRQTAVWARTFPARAAGAAIPATMAGGRRRVLEQAGIAGQLDPERLWALLRADVETLSTAVTAEQAEAMGAKREDEAVWLGTDEGREAERKETQQRREAYRRDWGQYPDEFSFSPKSCSTPTCIASNLFLAREAVVTACTSRCTYPPVGGFGA